MSGISGPKHAVLEALSEVGRATRADLAGRTGFSSATVGRAVDGLLRAGVLRDVAMEPAGVGRPPRILELDERASFVVAIDAGGRTLRASLADLGGNLRARAAHPVRDPGDGDALLEDLLAVIGEVSAPVRSEAVRSVVLGISGIVDAGRGEVLLAPDLPGLTGYRLGPELGRRLDRPVGVDNDDLLAAIGEAATGAAIGCRTVVFLSLGFGLGAGLVVDGRPVRGASHAAGAISYLAALRGGDRASGRAIAERYRAASGGPRALDARGVFELAASGDRVAATVVDEALESLGDLVVAAAALIDPEVVVLGGGLTDAGSALFDPLRDRLARSVPYPPRLAASALGDAAVLHGATSAGLAMARRVLGGLDPPPGRAARHSPPMPAMSR